MEQGVRYVQGDLLAYHGHYYIAHQCNCTTKGARGLAQQIFSQLGNNVYQLAPDARQPGSIIICDKVINMFAQVGPGKARSGTDSAEQRLQYFRMCLQQIRRQLPADAKVAFPYKISCGLAGGNWECYKQELQQFALANPSMEVLVVGRKEE